VTTHQFFDRNSSVTENKLCQDLATSSDATKTKNTKKKKHATHNFGLKKLKMTSNPRIAEW